MAYKSGDTQDRQAVNASEYSLVKTTSFFFVMYSYFIIKNKYIIKCIES